MSGAPSGARGNFTSSLRMGPDATGASGASVRCSGKACNLPGYGNGRYPVRPVPNSKHGTVSTAKDLTGRTHRASGAASGAPLGTKTSSKRDRSKTKLVSLDLRTISELPSARFTKCAPHLNLKPCLSQSTRSKPLLIVRSKENKVLNYSKCPSSPYGT